MRWIVVMALVTGCATTAPVLRQDLDSQGARIAQLEQRVTALETYIRQLYDVLARNGALDVRSAPVPETAPPPAGAPAPAPAPR